MNNATKQDLLPPLVADLLNDPVTYIDNVFADTWFGNKDMMATSLRLVCLRALCTPAKGAQYDQPQIGEHLCSYLKPD